jgi:uncharacterized protein YecE (DUF72 family)
MQRVLVGETRPPKDFKRYSKQFSLLELDCDPGNLPGKAKLQSWADLAPEGFVFSLVVPQRIAALEPGAEGDKAWKSALNMARLLRARWWVVRTPASVRPTRRSRDELGALFRKLGEGGMRVAWEPGGLWQPADAADTASNLGVHFVQDVARDEPLARDVLYARLLALGRGARVGLSVADTVVQRAREFAEAFIVVEGQGAREIVRAMGLEELEADADENAGEVADEDAGEDEDADEDPAELEAP